MLLSLSRVCPCHVLDCSHSQKLTSSTQIMLLWYCRFLYIIVVCWGYQVYVVFYSIVFDSICVIICRLFFLAKINSFLEILIVLKVIVVYCLLLILSSFFMVRWHYFSLVVVFHSSCHLYILLSFLILMPFLIKWRS